MSRVQIGLGQKLSDWLRKFQQARSLGQKIDQVDARAARATSASTSRRSANRTTGLSMGEHTEITAKEWKIGRAGAGRDRAAEPSQRRRRLGDAASSTTW